MEISKVQVRSDASGRDLRGSLTDPPGPGGPPTSNLFDYPKYALVTPLVLTGKK